jgi:hypothetical protein
MAPTQITEDYYAILEISQTADLTSIKSSYRRLAKAKHPDKNHENPNATAEFQLVSSFCHCTVSCTNWIKASGSILNYMRPREPTEL